MSDFETLAEMAEAGFYNQYLARLATAEVRFGLAYTHEDAQAVRKGTVVYPDQSIDLPDGGKLASTGSVILGLDPNNQVVKVIRA